MSSNAQTFVFPSLDDTVLSESGQDTFDNDINPNDLQKKVRQRNLRTLSIATELLTNFGALSPPSTKKNNQITSPKFLGLSSPIGSRNGSKFASPTSSMVSPAMSSSVSPNTIIMEEKVVKHIVSRFQSKFDKKKNKLIPKKPQTLRPSHSFRNQERIIEVSEKNIEDNESFDDHDSIRPKSGLYYRDDYLKELNLPIKAEIRQSIATKCKLTPPSWRNSPIKRREIVYCASNEYIHPNDLYKNIKMNPDLYSNTTWRNESNQQWGLQFDSNFECGNLLLAEQIFRQNINIEEYTLYIHPDPNLGQNICQWYCFKIMNTRKKSYCFNLCNLSLPNSGYSKGLRPLKYSQLKYESLNQGWVRIGKEIYYYPSIMQESLYLDQSVFPVSESYTLSFTHEFDHSHDTIYISYSQPYSYTQYQNYLRSLFMNPFNKLHCKKRILTKSICGNNLDLLTITENNDNKRSNDININETIDKNNQNIPNFLKKLASNENNELKQYQLDSNLKPIIFIICRFHPIDTSSNYILEGFINFLLSQSNQAYLLRKQYEFYIIPMANPDGVIHGYTRGNILGQDMNRQWKNCFISLMPNIYSIKQLLIQLKNKRNIISYIDFHENFMNDGITLTSFTDIINDKVILGNKELSIKLQNIINNQYERKRIQPIDIELDYYSHDQSITLTNIDPRLFIFSIAKRTKMINLNQCMFLNTNRINLLETVSTVLDIDSMLCMSILVSFRGDSNSGEYKYRHFCSYDYIRLGRIFGLSLHDVYNNGIQDHRTTKQILHNQMLLANIETKKLHDMIRLEDHMNSIPTNHHQQRIVDNNIEIKKHLIDNLEDNTNTFSDGERDDDDWDKVLKVINKYSKLWIKTSSKDNYDIKNHKYHPYCDCQYYWYSNRLDVSVIDEKDNETALIYDYHEELQRNENNEARYLLRRLFKQKNISSPMNDNIIGNIDEWNRTKDTLLNDSTTYDHRKINNIQDNEMINQSSDLNKHIERDDEVLETNTIVNRHKIKNKRILSISDTSYKYTAKISIDKDDDKWSGSSTIVGNRQMNVSNEVDSMIISYQFNPPLIQPISMDSQNDLKAVPANDKVSSNNPSGHHVSTKAVLDYIIPSMNILTVNQAIGTFKVDEIDDSSSDTSTPHNISNKDIHNTEFKFNLSEADQFQINEDDMNNLIELSPQTKYENDQKTSSTEPMNISDSVISRDVSINSCVINSYECTPNKMIIPSPNGNQIYHSDETNAFNIGSSRNIPDTNQINITEFQRFETVEMDQDTEELTQLIHQIDIILKTHQPIIPPKVIYSREFPKRWIKKKLSLVSLNHQNPINTQRQLIVDESNRLLLIHQIIIILQQLKQQCDSQIYKHHRKIFRLINYLTVLTSSTSSFSSCYKRIINEIHNKLTINQTDIFITGLHDDDDCSTISRDNQLASSFSKTKIMEYWRCIQSYLENLSPLQYESTDMIQISNHSPTKPNRSSDRGIDSDIHVTSLKSTERQINKKFYQFNNQNETINMNELLSRMNEEYFNVDSQLLNDCEDS